MKGFSLHFKINFYNVKINQNFRISIVIKFFIKNLEPLVKFKELFSQALKNLIFKILNIVLNLFLQKKYFDLIYI